jgi:pilus assembly protein CpaE
MPRVLVIDDDEGILKLIRMALRPRGYDVITAQDGTEGLNRIKAEQPDIVILDKMMPDLDGYEVARRLRREPRFAHIPILIITAASQLNDKLDAFNAGADDVLTKPFEVDELAARLTALLRRAEAFKAAQTQSLDSVENARLTVVHSLRGGIGCSSLAVNLAYGLRSLWQSPTLLLDMVMVAGQVSLMLDMPARRTWVDLASITETEFDFEALDGVINPTSSGLHFLASPKDPTDAEQVTASMVKRSLALLKPRYEYIVADLPHDFSDIALDLLEEADTILLLLAPDLVSVRAASVCLTTYSQLGFDSEKIQLVLNRTIAKSGLNGKHIEDALHHPISWVLPYAPQRFVNALNSGMPILESDPEDPISKQIEELAFYVSKESHQEIPPPAPSPAWHRINKRLQLFGTGQRDKKRGPLKMRLGQLFD